MAEIKIVLTTDASGAVTGFRTASGEAQKFEQAAKKMQTGVAAQFEQLKKHWLAVSAAVYASMQTIQKAWDLMNVANKYQEQMTVLNGLAKAYSTTGQAIVSALEMQTRGMISKMDLVSVAAENMFKGLRPDTLIELAKYADMVGDALGTGPVEGFNALARAATIGTDKMLKAIIGITDLDDALGEQVKTMSETEKVAARAALMMEKLEQRAAGAADGIESMADRMDRLQATLKNIELWTGQIIQRITALAGSALNYVATAVLTAIALIAKAVEQGAKLTDALGLTDNAAARMRTLFADAAKGAEETRSAYKDLFALATASEEELTRANAAMVKSSQGNAKAIGEVSSKFEDWKQKIEEMDPALSSADRQLASLTAEAAKFVKEGIPKSVVDRYLDLARAFLADAAAADKAREAHAKYAQGISSLDTALKMLNTILGDDTDEELQKMQDQMNEVMSLLAVAFDQGLIKADAMAEAFKLLKEKFDDFAFNRAWAHTTGELDKVEDKVEDVALAFGEGWQKGLDNFQKNMEWGFDKAVELAEDCAYALTNAFEDVFFGKFEEGLDHLVDYFKKVLAQMIATAMANPITIPISQATGQFLGGAGQAVSGGGSQSWLSSALGISPTSAFSGLSSLFTGGAAIEGLMSLFPASQFVADLATGFFGGFSAVGGITTALGAALPILLPALIALPLISGLFKDKDVPTLQARYSGEEWSVRTWNTGLSKQEKAQIAAGLNSFQGLLELFVTSIEGDVARLGEAWKKSKEFKGEGTIEEIMKSYMKSLDMDWSAFQKDGETFMETITGIVTAVAVIESIDEHDIRATFNAISLGEESLRDTLLNLDRDIGELVESLAGKTGLEYRAGLEEISSLVVRRYEVELAYLTEVKSLIESINVRTGDVKEQMLLDTFNREQKIDYYNKKAVEAYNAILEETDPAKVATLYDTWLDNITAGWALLTDTEKVKYLSGTMEWVDKVEQVVKDKLGNAVTEAETSFRTLEEQVAAIDWSALTTGASSAATALESIEPVNLGDYVTPVDLGDYVGVPPGQTAAPGYAVGIDYIPQRHLAYVDQGEAVLTPMGNRGIAAILSRLERMESGSPVVIQLNGKAEQVVDIAANRAVQLIRNNPGVLRR